MRPGRPGEVVEAQSEHNGPASPPGGAHPPGDAVDQANAAAPSPDSTGVFVTGESTGATTGYDWATIAYSA